MKKIISLCISLALIFTSASLFSMSAAATGNQQKIYYVLNGAAGDGRTEDSPAATVYDAVASVNADGLSTGDTANIYIMQNEDWNSYNGGLIGAVSGTQPHKMTSWAENGGGVPSHTATLVIQSYGNDNINYLAMTEKLGLYAPLECSGPTVFKNICIVSTRNIYSGIKFNGNNVTMGEGTTYGYIINSQFDGNESVWDGKVYPSKGFDETNLSCTPNGGATVYSLPMTLNIASALDNIIWISSNGYQHATFEGDVILNFSNEEANAYLKWGNDDERSWTLFEKNLNINMIGGGKLKHVAGRGTVTVKEGLQIFTDSDTQIDGSVNDLSNVIVEGGYWLVENTTPVNDIISFSSAKGVYYIKSSYSVVLTNTETMQKYYSEGNTVSVPAGKYTITDYERLSNSYYVKNGGTRDGRTEDSPAGTVYDAVISVNADGLSAGDTANIYIMQNEDWNSYNGGMIGSSSGTQPHRMTSWAENGGGVPEHTATLVIQSYDSTQTDYLAMTGKLGMNAPLECSGPTVFKNICIVSTRNIYSGIKFNGNSVTLGEGTTYGYVVNDEYGADAPWDGIVYPSGGFDETNLGSLPEGGASTFTNSMTLNVESRLENVIWISSSWYQHASFKEDVTLNFRNNEANALLKWGNSDSRSWTVFEKNLNVNMTGGGNEEISIMFRVPVK